ncbi:uncharacterized protein LOC130948731 isoform X1 [Arachis stenosperma]|uniref:uncharacterized protein LOC130948731 isoform X1 n=1 Tax=Arachis stenosperma TaxID=217475 RepID=UPI0025ACCD36|nr:uncharacterized protein LOC130948731 isoform X1 [Arachis stenosperma]
MRAFPSSHSSSFLFPQPPSSSSSSSTPPPPPHSLSFFLSFPFHFNNLSTPKPRSLNNHPHFFSCSASKFSLDVDHEDEDEDNDVASSSGDLFLTDDYDDDDDDYDDDGEVSEEYLAEDGVYIEVVKLGKNSRRIESRISVNASLDAVWSILTDYERLADFIPGLAVSQLLEKGENYARLLQIGQQNLAFGIKFNAKVVVDCYEKELETLVSGIKRDIEFKIIEGDFQVFEGKWSILQQFNNGSCEDSQVQVNTTLSYIVDIRPKLWLPVHLIEGRLCNEIKRNLVAVRDESHKAIDSTIHAC